MQQGNLISTEEKNGDLYLKYFFVDDSVARKVRNPTTGEWEGIETPLDFSVASDVITKRDQEAIGLPFSILPVRELSLFGDYHPWSPKEGATWEDHVAFARSYSPGVIEAITPNSSIVSGAVNDIKSHNGRFAVVHITHKETNEAYKRNPALIPQNVSPGFLNLDAPNTKNIRNLRWAHLAAVPMGAFGEKASLYGTCIGAEGCLNQLVAGSVANLSERITYCPVGASIMLTSLLQNNGIDHKMESTSTTTTEQKPLNPTPPVTGTQQTGTGAPITDPNKPKVIRLKTAGQPMQNQSNQPLQAGQGQGQDTSELDSVKKMVEELKLTQEQNARADQLRKLIPKELFIMKGKFDEKGFEAEVAKRLNSNWDDATLQEFYNGKLELLKFGIQMPKNDPNAQLNPMGTGMPESPGAAPTGPTGGSSYKSPSDVPEYVGGAADIENYNNANVRQLLSRFVRPE